LGFDEDTINLVTAVEIDSKNSNQPNEKGRCAPPEDSNSAIEKPFDLPGIE